MVFRLNGCIQSDTGHWQHDSRKAVQADEFELAFRQVSKYSGRSGGGFLEGSCGRSWPAG